jgi:hypothetical protein
MPQEKIDMATMTLPQPTTQELQIYKAFFEQACLNQNQPEPIGTSFQNLLSQTAAVITKTFKPYPNRQEVALATKPKIFISYAWPILEEYPHEWLTQHFIIQLYYDLRKTGFEVMMDMFCSRFGHDSIAYMAQGIKESDFVLLIGTRSLLQKHLKSQRFGCAIRQELNHIKRRIQHDRESDYGDRVIPLILSGDIKTALPAEYEGYTIIESFIDKPYLAVLYELLQAMLLRMSSDSTSELIHPSISQKMLFSPITIFQETDNPLYPIWQHIRSDDHRLNPYLHGFHLDAVRQHYSQLDQERLLQQTAQLIFTQKQLQTLTVRFTSLPISPPGFDTEISSSSLLTDYQHSMQESIDRTSTFSTRTELLEATIKSIIPSKHMSTAHTASESSVTISDHNFTTTLSLTLPLTRKQIIKYLRETTSINWYIHKPTKKNPNHSIRAIMLPTQRQLFSELDNSNALKLKKKPITNNRHEIILVACNLRNLRTWQLQRELDIHEPTERVTPHAAL